MKLFARVDKIVGVLGHMGALLPVENVNLEIAKVLTTDYEFKQRTVLYRNNITRAKIEAIVRQRYTVMSTSTSRNNHNVGQAIVANKPARRNRKQKGSGKNGRYNEGVVGKGTSGSAAATKKRQQQYEGRGEEVRQHAERMSPMPGARSSIQNTSSAPRRNPIAVVVR